MKRFLFALFACLVLSTAGTASASANDFNSLYNSAKSYLGVPYKWGGTTASGFDCSGYTQAVFKNNKISIPRTTGGQYNTGKAVAKSNLQSGDLVFFNTSGRGVSHVGIYVGSNKFIHASTSQGVMVSALNDPYYWGSRYIGARRVANFSTAPAKPAAPVESYPTRAEVAELLANELGLNGLDSDIEFNDVAANHPQAAAINAVAAAGIFSGNNGNFKPNDNLTRAEMSKVLVESFGLTERTEIFFKDIAPTNWATPYVQTLYAYNITRGYGDGNFGANDKVTTNQLKTFIKRIQGL